MLTSEPTPLPATLATRLIVEPRIRVRTSVLPAEDPERASAVCADSGVPLAILARHGATVRQTHRRANVVVIDVPAERQDALRSDLAAAGFDARPPKPVFPLLNESVPTQHVPAIWRAGFEGAGVRIAIVDTGADRHPDFAGRIALVQDFTEHGDLDDVGHGTHVAGIVAGAGDVYRGVAPKATLVIAKALAGDGGSEDAVRSDVVGEPSERRRHEPLARRSGRSEGSAFPRGRRAVGGWHPRVRRGGELGTGREDNRLAGHRGRRDHRRRDGQAARPDVV